MMDAARLLPITLVAIIAVNAGLGYEAAYEITYGAFTLMAAMVSLTFLWLWQERATPLAAGMALSWGGSAFVMGWWWVYNLLDRPAVMQDSSALFLCLAIYFVGAILHFALIGRSLGVSRSVWTLPVLLAIAVSATLHFTNL